MEAFAIGPMLRETAAVALRHWALGVLAAVTLAATCVANIALVVHVIVSGSLPEELARAALAWFEWILWGANRCANWVICGVLIRRILATESARAPGLGRPSPWPRGLIRCLAFLVTLSLVSYAADPLDRLTYEFFLVSPGAGWTAWTISNTVAVCTWAYIDARFAVYIAPLVSGGRDEGFASGWRHATGHRLRLFGLFLVIETPSLLLNKALYDSAWLASLLAPVTRAIESFVDVPFLLLYGRLANFVAFSLYVVTANLLCAAAFFVIYRRGAVRGPAAEAQVFD